MCEYLKLKIEISILKHVKFENLKIEMSQFGCVTIEN
jgi:hypothetical protein